MQNLQRVSRLMQWVTSFALILMPLTVLAGIYWAEGAEMPAALVEGFDPPIRDVRLAVAIGLIPVGALFWTVWKMNRLFAQFQSGDVLTHGVAGVIRQIGTGLLATAVLRLLAVPLSSLAISASAPEGSRFLSVQLTSADLGFLLSAGLMAAIGWAMEEAARTADENKGFV